jgi:hypothetical protein
MNLSAVILARVLAYVESFDLNPRGKAYYPDIVRALVERYNFQKFPQALEEFNESKGVEFHEGRAGNKVIQKFVIWDTLLVLETRSSTDDSKQILEEMLMWGVEKFGLNYKPGMIKHFAYISDLTFYSNAPLLGGSQALTNLATKTSEALAEIWREPVHYELVNLQVGHDPTARKYGIAPFSISRRAEAKLSENKYFSEAPLPTDLHIRLLEQYEAEVSKNNPNT